MPRSGPRPHVRRYPDPVDHQLFVDCMRARAQAWYRNEVWNITEDDYIALWRTNNYYKHKGRHNDEYCLVRKNYDLPWQLSNVHVITRLEHYQICSKEKIGKCADRKHKKEQYAKQ